VKSAFTLPSKILQQVLNPAAVLTVSAFFLIATFSLSMSAQNTLGQGVWFTALLAVNAVGIVVLLLFLLCL
jgi:hypothetical protein